MDDAISRAVAQAVTVSIRYETLLLRKTRLCTVCQTILCVASAKKVFGELQSCASPLLNICTTSNSARLCGHL